MYEAVHADHQLLRNLQIFPLETFSGQKGKIVASWFHPITPPGQVKVCKENLYIYSHRISIIRNSDYTGFLAAGRSYAHRLPFQTLPRMFRVC